MNIHLGTSTRALAKLITVREQRAVYVRAIN